jgi:serine/threonine-protein kinase
MTGQSEVVIETGGGENGFSFNPSGVTVSTGTNIVWEWTGNGGAHNIVSEESSNYDFESELTDEEGYTTEQIASTAGVMFYVCVPHRAQGMYGAVAVINE